MRLHRTHEIVAPWSTGTPVLDPARLAAVRVEPVFRQRRPVLALDLCLAGDDGLTVIPLVLVEPATVIERDRDPLILPQGTPGGDDLAAALAEHVLPHLERLVLGGAHVVEHVVRFGEAAAFDAARAHGCFGAAPLRDALARLAPYRYARRFVHGRTVCIDAPDAVGGWALLRTAGTVAVASDRREPGALAWYGDAPAADSAAEVAIVDRPEAANGAAVVVRTDEAGGGDPVPVVDGLPLDVGIVFDSAEAPVRRWFAVERAPEPAPRPLPELRYAPAGGSGGQIAIVLGRPGAADRPSADTDEAAALAAALGAEGFDARIMAGLDELAGADLIHLVGTRDGRWARAVVDAGRRLGVPVAVHAHDDDAANGGWWGAEVTRFCFEYGSDERDVANYLAMLARRAVVVGAARADQPYAPDGAGTDEAASALRDAAVVCAATEEEADAVRRRSGRRGPVVVVPPLAGAVEPAPVGRLVGPDPFLLVHAPIGPGGNQLLVARCAADAGLPLVVAGPVEDASYLERVREFGGPRLIVLAGEPAPAVAAGLRAAAAVVVDGAWLGHGGSRIAAAALAGARLALADRRRFVAPGVEPRRFDPADAAAATRSLAEAWDEAVRSPARTSPETVAALAPTAVVRAIVRGYAAVAGSAT